MNYLMVLLIIILDQLSKYIVQSIFSVNKSMPIIENIFHLTYVRNVGAAFGILQNQKMFFVIITLVVISGIILFTRTQTNIHKLVVYSLSLIVGGAIGNLIDRIRFGYVVDFFDFRIWPVFNIADISIVVGAILLSYYLIIIDRVRN
ncbi:signal peptidase II [Crassaminicella thermophila]|uniref:Lipoprotein signal peptidase n=1 Tax=Crassaminicella thermophila TaxID=2599308 RepID=A0A5C0SDZ9_CRATE|nr:signal peptidase II [Crassaminicella thermophila]QEK11986.1 signal peptidase II [Crassaminicella thermophila]